MAGSRRKRWAFVLLDLVLLLAGSGVIGYRLAAERLKEKVAAALGPGSEIGALKLRWSSVEVVGLSIRSPQGWPAPRTFQSERVKIVPSLRSLFTGRVRISSIIVEKPYLSILRSGGRLRLIPTLLEKSGQVRPARGGGFVPAPRAVSISEIVLRDGVIELFDATVARPPLKLRFERIEAVVRDIDAPEFQERIQFELQGLIKGISRDGRVKMSGWLRARARDSSTRIVLESVDLVKVQPYLIRAGEARVSRGTLDLDLQSDVRNHRLDGSGKVVLKKLEFEPSRGFFETFMGVPRTAMIQFLKNHEDAIEVSFTIKGDVENPSFSLNEAMATRIAAAVAEVLGVSIKGVAGGVEILGRKGLEGAGEAAGALGSALRGLFGGTEKK